MVEKVATISRDHRTMGRRAMKIGRSIMLAMAATLGASGCRRLEYGLARPRSPSAAGRTRFDLDEFVAEHNRNAERIQSLEAKPTIGVAEPALCACTRRRPAGAGTPAEFQARAPGPMHGRHQGRHRLERRGVLVLGQQNEERKIYWCNYDELESSSLAVTYQPDWIIEALGLKPISRRGSQQDQGPRGRGCAGQPPWCFPPTNEWRRDLHADDDRLEPESPDQGAPHLRGDGSKPPGACWPRPR